MVFIIPPRFVPFLVLGVWASLLVGPTTTTAAPTQNPITGSFEKYGTTPTGVGLYWTAYVPPEGGKHPAVLVLHTGGFKAGAAGPQDVAQDLAANGFVALATEYRLAPPHLFMNSYTDAFPQGIHPTPGQNAVYPVDEGHYPEQTDDVKMAVRAARADPRCNGLVYAVGGSAGASHTVYLAATGTVGDDKIDLGVALSGPYQLDDEAHLNAQCVDGETCFSEAVINYVGVPDITHTAELHAASPTTYITSAIPPLFLMASTNDTGGVDTYQLPDLIKKLDSVGVTESTAATPQLGHYKSLWVPVIQPTHAFDYWSYPIAPGSLVHVKDLIIAWLQARPPSSNQPPLPTPTPSPTPAATPIPELLNLSTRANVLDSDSVMIGGFIVTGGTSKRVVLRALGPSLAHAGVTGVLANPILELYDSTGTLIEQNNNYTSPLPDDVVASGLTPSQPDESLIAATLRPGRYTAVIRGTNGSTGVALFELYDLSPGSSRVTNISTRGHAGPTDDAMIGGFIVGGTAPSRVLIRALGPSLGAAGVAGSLADPILELHDRDGSLIFQNDNWRTDQEQQIIDSTIPPLDDREAAIEITLPAGAYTAIARGAGNSTGVGLVEVYSLD